MKSVILVAILLVIAQPGSGSYPKAKDLGLFYEIRTVQNIGKYLREHPGTTTTALKFKGTGKKGENLYTLGARQAGDQLLDWTIGEMESNPSKDVEMDLAYPKPNIVASKITHLRVLLHQESGKPGRAYIVSGGVGQRNFHVIIEALKPIHIKYDISLYGK